MKLHTVYKGTLSGVLFALIVQKIPLSNLFYTSTATDASDKYEVCEGIGKARDSVKIDPFKYRV